MKRFFALLCALTLCLSTFSACKKGDEKATTTTTSANVIQEEENEFDYPPVDQDLQGEPSVVLSQESGIYGEKFSLAMTAVEENTEIYYTIDGSNPTTSETAIKYEGEIEITDRKGDKNVVSAVSTSEISGNFNEISFSEKGYVCTIENPSDESVDKCTVVRAVAKNSDGSFGAESSATYFIGTMEEHIQGLSESCKASGMDLAVISLSVNFDDFFGSENGIYVKGDIFAEDFQNYMSENGTSSLYDPETARKIDANYKQRGKAWERETRLVMLECNADGVTEVLNQTCGVRIQGNYSRSDIQKGLRLYARDIYGSKNFKYAVFGDEYKSSDGETMDKFKKLVLRAGGNCAFNAKFNDTFWQSLAESTACETKQSRPCVVYLNGEYWGLYILEEDYDNDHFEEKYGVEKDDVIVYKGDAESLALGYKLDEGDLPEGESDESYYFNELLSFINSHKSLKNQSDYDEFAKLVDVESVKDYFLIQCFINNKWDWPGKNWSMWKTANVEPSNPYADGKWRLMFYDLDFGGVNGSGEARDNTVQNANYKENGLLDMNTNNPAVLSFALLMTNDNFRSEFCEEMLALPEGIMNKDNALEVLNTFEGTYSPLYDQFFARYEGTNTSDDAVNGGYASVKCLREFLEKRENNLKLMTKYIERILG